MTSVLVVDDSRADRKMAGNLLEQQLQVAVTYATDGQDAMRQFERHVPDLVVTDLMMPGMDGLELIELVKKQYPLTAVIMMTSRGSEEIAVTALEKGAASYVPKKILARRLPDTVDRALKTPREDKNHARLMEQLVADECTFILQNDITLISTLVRFLRHGIRGVNLCDKADNMRTAVAIEEALLNAYYHGNLEVSSELRGERQDEFDRLVLERSQASPYRDRQIHVQAKYSELEAVIVIRDEGIGFDHTQIPDPTDPENLLQPTGRGLLLMRAFMDELHFNAAGNQVTMIKRRSK